MNNQTTPPTPSIRFRPSSQRYRIDSLGRILVCLIFATFQLAAKPFVWEVKHPNKPGTVYLAGSIHVLHEYDPLPPLYDTLLPHCDKVIIEANIKAPEAIHFIRARALLTPPDTLRNYLSPATYQELEAFLTSRGMDHFTFPYEEPVHFSRLRPWFALVWVEEVRSRDYGLFGYYGVEFRFLDRIGRSKLVQYLETLDLQTQILESSITGIEDAAIASALHDNPEELVSLWKAGDDAGLEAKIEEFRSSFPGASSILFDQRNLNWLNGIESEMNGNTRIFFLVGAGHMFGSTGLLKLLNDRGYSIQRLPSAPRILQQPASRNTTIGSTVTFTVKATGTPPFSYQWYKGGDAIAYETDASLRLPNVESRDATNYSVVVQNVNGAMLSSNAVLKVYDEAEFTSFYVRSDARKMGLYLMDNTNFVAAAQVNEGNGFGPEWLPVGLGRFDHGSQEDILFQNTDGRLALWLMQGTSRRESVPLKSPSSSWRAVALANFNSDIEDKPDILFRHLDGRLAIWYMYDVTFSSAVALNGGKPIGVDWRVVSAAHFDNDGKPDLLMQKSTGAVAVWLLDGTNIVSRLPIRDGIAVGARAAAAVDVDKNGQTDIVFQRTSGQMSVWYMNGTNFLSASPIQNAKPLPNPWRVFGGR